MTPRDFCEKIDSETPIPIQTSLYVVQKKILKEKRPACSLLEGETSVNNSFELNSNVLIVRGPV